MNRVIISTTGTSLLTNWKRVHDSSEEPSFQDLLSFINANEEASAETNSLSKLNIDPNRDVLYFVGSDTPDGRFSLQVIEHYYQSKGYNYVFPQYVVGLKNRDYHDFQTRGLPNLLKTLCTIRENHLGTHLIINATGGFKAQTAYATLFGIIFGIEVVYLYEDFKNLLRFPQMPINIDSGLIKSHMETITKIIQSDTKKESRQLLNTLPVSLRGFLEKRGDYYEYSPVGRVFMAALELDNQVCRQYVVRTYKSHTSLWGDGINSIEEITDAEVRELFYRIFDCSGAVTSIFLDDMVHRKSEEVYLEYRETVGNSLRYLLHTPYGGEYLKLEVIPGHEKEVMRRIGKKIYP